MIWVLRRTGICYTSLGGAVREKSKSKREVCMFGSTCDSKVLERADKAGAWAPSSNACRFFNALTACRIANLLLSSILNSIRFLLLPSTSQFNSILFDPSYCYPWTAFALYEIDLPFTWVECCFDLIEKQMFATYKGMLPSHLF